MVKYIECKCTETNKVSVDVLSAELTSIVRAWATQYLLCHTTAVQAMAKSLGEVCGLDPDIDPNIFQHLNLVMARGFNEVSEHTLEFTEGKTEVVFSPPTTDTPQ